MRDAVADSNFSVRVTSESTIQSVKEIQFDERHIDRCKAGTTRQCDWITVGSAHCESGIAAVSKLQHMKRHVTVATVVNKTVKFLKQSPNSRDVAIGSICDASHSKHCVRMESGTDFKDAWTIASRDAADLGAAVADIVPTQRAWEEQSNVSETYAQLLHLVW